MSRTAIDRPEIHAALGVSEFWRFDGEIAAIEQLETDGVYAAAQRSRFVPVRPEDIHRCSWSAIPADKYPREYKSGMEMLSSGPFSIIMSVHNAQFGTLANFIRSIRGMGRPGAEL